MTWLRWSEKAQDEGERITQGVSRRKHLPPSKPNPPVVLVPSQRKTLIIPIRDKHILQSIPMMTSSVRTAPGMAACVGRPGSSEPVVPPHRSEFGCLSSESSGSANRLTNGPVKSNIDKWKVCPPSQTVRNLDGPVTARASSGSTPLCADSEALPQPTRSTPSQESSAAFRMTFCSRKWGLIKGM